MTLIIVVHFPFPLNVEGSEMRGKCMLSATRLYWNWAPCSDRRSLRNFILYNYAFMVLWLDLYLIRFHFKRPLQPHFVLPYMCIHTDPACKKKKCACFINWCSTIVSLLSKWSRIFLPVELQHRVTSSDSQVCVGGGGGCYPIPSDS